MEIAEIHLQMLTIAFLPLYHQVLKSIPLGGHNQDIRFGNFVKQNIFELNLSFLIKPVTFANSVRYN